MHFDEFLERLRKLKIEYKLNTGKDLNTVEELEQYLDRRLVKRNTRNLKSLKGLSF
jgi:hypothetical protein